MIKNGQWNGLNYQDKQAIVHTGNSALDLANLVASYKNFDDLPNSKKNLIINDGPARQKLKDAGILVKNYNHTFIAPKSLTADNQDIVNKLKIGQNGIIN